DLDEKFKAARASFPNVTAALGEQIFRSQNCAACHRHGTINLPVKDAAPDLAQEGNRVNRSWLEGYLKHPVAIRPFGFHPGNGSRMPDFRLTGEESARIASFLSASVASSGEFRPQKLSAFSMKKMELLMAEKFACTGCHRLGDKGGRIGPDLTGVGD